MMTNSKANNKTTSVNDSVSFILSVKNCDNKIHRYKQYSNKLAMGVCSTPMDQADL